MRIPASVRAASRYFVAFTVVAGSLALMSAPKKTVFNKHDKAYYADPNLVNFVRPGLNITISSAKIATDGTISVSYKIADPKGLPLDLAGVQTPGTVTISFVAAYIPQGEKQFWSYTTRPQTSPITKNTAIQASTDSGGTTTTNAVGDYTYTFKTKAAAKDGSAFDPNATHRIGVYGNRNLTEFDLGTNYDSETFDFVPSGAKVASTREVIKNATCNKCHQDLAFHGGSRKGIELCIMCHQPQTVDPDTGNSVDSKVFFHKLHMGSQLPSVQAGTPYKIIGYQQGVSDFSTVNLPSDPRRCEFCHESTTGAQQADAWLKNPSRAACGACHDNVDFATGKNHVNLPQVDDKQCTTCHIPQGELEFDASIKNAHIVPTEAPSRPGLVLDITKIDNGAAGKAPTVTFTAKDFSGKAVTMKDLTGGANRLALVLAGPTSDYGYTKFGSDVTTNGYVSENPVPTAQCSADGTCSYTFTHAVPAGATGTYAIGIEGRRAYTILPGTTKETATEYGAKNVVKYFSVDGSPVQPRRTVVAIKNCNGCHSTLSMHGENRNQVEQCVLCHNPSENDSAYKNIAKVPADKTSPPQAINFAMMVHKIHTGEKMATEFNTTYTIVGYGGSHNDFSDIRYPVMTPTGETGDTAKCDMCHVNNSETVFPIGKNNVADTQGLLNPAPATTSACTACHQNKSALAHAVAQTDPKFGESCDVCHAAGAEFDVNKVHAGK